MNHKKHILKSTGQIGGATFISRILGLIRDIITAAIFGATTLWDAFVLAYTIPNLFRRLFGEGALTAAFVPVFTDSLIHEERKKSWHFANTTITALILSLITLVIGIDIVLFITSKIFTFPVKYSFAISLTYVLLPYTILICCAALFMGILNSFHHFIIPAISPAVLNIVWIIILIFICPFFKNNPSIQIYILSFGILLGGLIQAGMQIPVLKAHGFRYHFSLNFKLPAFKKILFLMGPTVIGVAVFQINVLVDRLLAFFLREGAASVLFYSNRLVQFPLALFGISLATAVLPIMSKSVSTNNIEEFKNTLIHGTNMLLTILIPASLGLILLAIPISELIFQHGAFTYISAVRTGYALASYAIGLFAFAYYKLIAQGFYARKDMITPVKVGVFCVLLNLVLNIILMFPLKESGLALATSITSYINVIILFFLLKKSIGKIPYSHFSETLKKVLLATAIMSLICISTRMIVSKLFLTPNFASKLLNVCIPMITSIICVTLSYRLLRLKEFNEIVRIILRKDKEVT
ncbi:murein biosynthesis integral membrane protein MurJ [Chlamydiota bacterium]